MFVNLNLNVRDLSPSATLAINEKSNELIRNGHKVYKLGLGQSPFPVPEEVVESLRQNAHQKDYLPVRGLPALREAIAGFNARVHDLTCNPEDVMIGPGSKELIFILQLVYYGDLIIPTPSWVSYSPQAKIIGRNVQWVPTSAEHKWRLSPERLDLICRNDPNRPRIMILNYPSNPTGCTYYPGRLEKLAAVARKYNVVLVSDEIYGLLHHEARHVSIAKFYPEGTIVSSGLSKWCGAGGWRLGCFTFPPALRWLQDAMAIVASETYTSTSAPIQYAAVTAFKGSETIDAYLIQCRRILKKLADYLLERMKQANIMAPLPHGAFYIFPDFSYYRERLEKQKIFTSVEMCRKLLQKTGVGILPGSDFGRQPEELTARIAYVNFDGAEAIRVAETEYHHKHLDEAYLKRCCPDTINGVERMCGWFAGL
jgi:aspartate aminotransferase